MEKLDHSGRSLSVTVRVVGAHPFHCKNVNPLVLVLVLPSITVPLPAECISGAKIEASTDTKLTPLMVAAQEGRVSAVKLLLRAGARVKVTPPPLPPQHTMPLVRPLVFVNGFWLNFGCISVFGCKEWLVVALFRPLSFRGGYCSKKNPRWAQKSCISPCLVLIILQKLPCKIGMLYRVR